MRIPGALGRRTNVEDDKHPKEVERDDELYQV